VSKYQFMLDLIKKKNTLMENKQKDGKTFTFFQFESIPSSFNMTEPTRA
jgi:hypothetical protein